MNEKAPRVPNAFPIEQELQELTPKVCCRRAYEHDSFLPAVVSSHVLELYFKPFDNIDRRSQKFRLIVRVWKGMDVTRSSDM